jgi:hypothetical protein
VSEPGGFVSVLGCVGFTGSGFRGSGFLDSTTGTGLVASVGFGLTISAGLGLDTEILLFVSCCFGCGTWS